MQAEPKKSLVGEEYEVEVGPVAHGGHCIARTSEGQVLFVRHALPGERVVARVTEGEEGARFLRADAVSVLSASKDRVEAPCPYAGPGRCGGCDWQHAKPGAQRRLKGEVVAEQLRRLAGLTPEEAGWDGTVMPAEGDKVPAGQVPAWRTRVQYAVTADGRAGLRRHRSHEVEPIDHCMIAAEGVSELGIEKRDWTGMDSVEAIAATGSACARRVDVELRMDAIASVVQHQDYRIVREEPVAGRVDPTRRVLVDLEMGTGPVTAAPFVVVQTGEGRWLVQEVPLETLMGGGR